MLENCSFLIALPLSPRFLKTRRTVIRFFVLGPSEERYYRTALLQRNRERITVRGLNDNHNKDLKNLFKSAAISASTRPGPLRDFYVARVEKGMRPTMARLTLARKMAAISLTIWKKGVEFDAQQLQRQTV